MNNKKQNKILYFSIGVFSLLLLWTVVSLIVGNGILMPTPWSTVKEMGLLLTNGDFYTAIFNTALRCITGFLASCLLAVIFAVIAYLSPKCRIAFTPLVTVFRATPTMSIIFLVLVWLHPQISPAFIGFLVTFPLLYENFYTSICGVDKKLLEMSKSYQISTFNKILYVYLPCARAGILSGAKSGISLNVKVVISAEVMAYTAKSIGTEMLVTQMDIFTAKLFAWTLWAILLSFAFEGLIALISYLTNPKRKKSSKD